MLSPFSLTSSLCLSVDLVPAKISHRRKWLTNGQTVAGGQRGGDVLNQLSCPYGLDIYDDDSLIIADVHNHRIMRWKISTMNGQIIAGGKGQGDRLDQFDRPAAVMVDRINNCLIISDEGNRRVMR